MLHRSYAIKVWNDGLITGNHKWVQKKGCCQKCHKEDFLHWVRWLDSVPSHECRECIERHLLCIGLEGQTLFRTDLGISNLPKWIVERLITIEL